MATYYVSGIWTNNNVITDLNVHLVTNDDKGNVTQAKRITLEQGIQLVEAGHDVYTANWYYAGHYWAKGARIHVVKESGQKYLRSNHDRNEKDNLDNMVPMTNLGC